MRFIFVLLIIIEGS